MVLTDPLLFFVSSTIPIIELYFERRFVTSIFGGYKEQWTFVIDSDYSTKIERFMKENGIRFKEVTSCTVYKNNTLAVYTVMSSDTIRPTIDVVRREITYLEQNE